MKSMLIIDTPESCEECPLRSYSNLALQCTPLRKTKEEDDVCPLRPMPKWTVNRNCAFSEKGGAIPDEWVYDFLTEIMGETE